MFLMNKQEIQNEIDKINTYLHKCLWMDFELCQMSAKQIVMAGAIDQSYGKYDIDIIFEQPYFVSSLFSWKTNTSKTVIQLVSAEEEYEFNIKYQVELGNYIFKINIEDFNNSIFIGAKKITCIIHNENPFLNN